MSPTFFNMTPWPLLQSAEHTRPPSQCIFTRGTCRRMVYCKIPSGRPDARPLVVRRAAMPATDWPLEEGLLVTTAADNI